MTGVTTCADTCSRCIVIPYAFCMLSALIHFSSFRPRWRCKRSGRSISARPRLPTVCPGNACLVEHRSFQTSEGGTSAASFLRSPFLQTMRAGCDSQTSAGVDVKARLLPIRMGHEHTNRCLWGHAFRVKHVPLPDPCSTLNLTYVPPSQTSRVRGTGQSVVCLVK